MTPDVFAAPEAGEVKVYLARPGHADKFVERVLTALLEEAERARAARLLRPQDRISHRPPHALLQRALRGSLRRSNFRLLSDAVARLGLTQPPEQPLWFNLSHTSGMVTCALPRAPVGIDVEGTGTDRDWHAIACRCFHPDELAWIERAPTTEQRARFTTFWTLNEAVIKAAGRGLAIPLNSFAVDPDGLHPPVRTNDSDLTGMLWLARHAFPAHQLRLALRKPAAKIVSGTESTAAPIADGSGRTTALEHDHLVQDRELAA